MRFLSALRSALLLVTSLLVLSCSGSPSAVDPSSLETGWRNGPVVGTRSGAVRGEADVDATWVWRGIPYAAPPVGELRWKAPRDPEPWAGVRETIRFGAPSTQFRPLSRGAIVGSEDCLTLNVWRPRSEERALPVYVWIHGGGNSMGSSAYVPDYYGNRLAAASNMVFVSVNYRLGPMGWFAHPALAEGESAEDASGNYGTLDLIQALRWIRDNIGAFGGDPGRVAIAGESAGAMNVLSLMIAPSARLLFTHAIAESGAATTRTVEDAWQASSRVLEDLLIRDHRAATREQARERAATMSAAEIRAYLRGKSDREILRCYQAGSVGMIANPAILRDGTVIPRDGYGALARGEYAKVPLIIGSNKEELKLFLFFDPKKRRDQPLYQAVARWGSERWKAEGVDGVARRLVASVEQPPVYAYQFCWGAPDAQGRSPLPGSWGRFLGAFHSLEIPFFLGTDTVEGKLLGSALFTRRNEAGRKTLSSAIMRYLSSFVRSGDPNPADGSLPRWLPWSNDAGGSRSILWDVRGDEPAITMTGTELTSAAVDERMQRELPPELYARAAATMAASMVTLKPD